MVQGLVSTSGTSDAVTKPLWAPWRLEYVQSADEQPGCVFCLAQAGDDEETLVVHRGELAFALLNRFPYSSGHFMVAPYRHVGVYAELTDDEVLESTGSRRKELKRLASSTSRTATTSAGTSVASPARAWSTTCTCTSSLAGKATRASCRCSPT